MSLDKPNLDYIKLIYRNTRLKKIVNVYQKNYINIKGQGFGDFLRGSIYLTYVCIVLGLDFDIDIQNHPMSMYLNDNISSYNICYSNIEAFIDYFNNIQNERDFIVKFIQKLNDHKEETYYLFTNFKPLFNIENPKFNIIQTARNVIIPKIEPKKLILDILDNKLDVYGIKRNRYGIIHVRAGDYFMNIKKTVDSEKHKISLKHVNDIITLISSCCSMEKKYILVGDSNEIKAYISNKFTNIITFGTPITHLGEDDTINNNAIIGTLLDFNIMRFSNCIISFTAYAHGSGFSKYCSTLYGVPFKQIILTPTLTYNI
jgi:hypothetical protein